MGKRWYRNRRTNACRSSALQRSNLRRLLLVVSRKKIKISAVTHAHRHHLRAEQLRDESLARVVAREQLGEALDALLSLAQATRACRLFPTY